MSNVAIIPQRPEDIPAICKRAVAALSVAETLGDVQAIQAHAEALLAYAARLKAAEEAKAEIQRVILLAEATIGAKLKEAQAAGQVATQERHGAGIQSSVPARNTRPATHEEIGITRKQAMNAKHLADAGSGRINEVVDRAIAEGRQPTRTEILEAAKRPARHNQGGWAGGRKEQARLKRDYARLMQAVATIADAEDLPAMAKIAGSHVEDDLSEALTARASLARLIEHLKAAKRS